MIKKKKEIIIGTIIAVILVIAIVLLTIKLINIRKNKQNDENIDENIVIENEIIDNEVDNELNNESESVIENETINDENDNTTYENTAQNKIESTPIADSEQEVDEQTIQKQQSAQEKAISIAKKDWGEDNTVYFSYEGNNNGKYRVCVRKADTTYAIRYYIINVNNGTFEIEE